MPKPKRSSVSGKPAAKAAAKRQRRRPSTPVHPETPFVSLLTTHDYVYNAAEEDPHTILTLTPVNPDVPLPANTGPFFRKAASAFAREVHDVLLGPEYLVLIFTMDEAKVATYYQYVKQGRIRVPNSDFAVVAKAAVLDELLESYLEPSTFQAYLVAMGMRAASDEASSDDFTTDSSSSEGETMPSTPTRKPRMPLLAIRRDSTNVSLTSASVSTNPEPAVLPATVTEVPAVSTESPATPISLEDDAMDIAQSQADLEPEPTSASQARARKPRTRWVAVDFDKLVLEIPPKDETITILFRPTDKEVQLKKTNPMSIFKALKALGPEPLTIRDIRDGGLAVDYPPGTPVQQLLLITTILDHQVTAALPKIRTGCQGVIKGVHCDLSEEDILEAMQTVPPTSITEVKRLARPGEQSFVIKVSFASDTLPEKARFFGRSYRINAYRNKPLLCFKCGRYGHSIRVCRSTLRCWTCSQDHKTQDCPNKATPTCCSCNGPHATNSDACPNHKMQLKICEVKADHKINFKEARKVVTNAARSYSAALKGTPKPTPPQPAAQKKATKATTTGPQFKQNIAHPRPPTPDATATILAELFQGLLAILTTAASTQDFASALTSISSLFQASAPGADPRSFSLPA